MFLLASTPCFRKISSEKSEKSGGGVPASASSKGSLAPPERRESDEPASREPAPLRERAAPRAPRRRLSPSFGLLAGRLAPALAGAAGLRGHDGRGHLGGLAPARLLPGAPGPSGQRPRADGPQPGRPRPGVGDRHLRRSD